MRSGPLQGEDAAAGDAAAAHQAAVEKLTKLLEARRKQYEFSDIEVCTAAYCFVLLHLL